MRISQAHFNRPVPAPRRTGLARSASSAASSMTQNVAPVKPCNLSASSSSAMLTGRGAMLSAPGYRAPPSITPSTSKGRVDLRPGRLVRPTAGWSQDCMEQTSHHFSPPNRTLEGGEVRISRPMSAGPSTTHARPRTVELERPHSAPAGKSLMAVRRPPPRPAISAPSSPNHAQHTAQAEHQKKPSPSLPGASPSEAESKRESVNGAGAEQEKRQRKPASPTRKVSWSADVAMSSVEAPPAGKSPLLYGL